MLTAVAQAVEARDPFACGHSERVTALAVAVGRQLGWETSRLARLRLGGLLHDIGKLAVEVDVLRKPTALSDDERAQIRAHPEVGAKMLEPVDTARLALTCVLLHHERWDGHGYPYGVAGNAIPLEARVLAIADAFDAMTSFRPYRATLEPRQALDELLTCAGSQFDPRLVWVFAEAYESGALAPAARAAAS